MAEVTITKTRTKEVSPDMSQTIKVVTTKEITPQAQPLRADAVSLQSYMLLGAICAVVTWALVNIVKEFIQARLKLKGKAKPWYYLASIRLMACVFGSGTGWFLSDSFGMGNHFAIAAGAAAGAMSSVIVKVIKARARKAAEG